MKSVVAKLNLLAAGMLLVVLAFGCGGGGSSFSPPPPPPPTLTITTQSPLPRAVLGRPYTAKLQASGGTPPYSWSTQLLGIPGMSLAADGTLSGTPTQQANFGPSITVTDAKGATATSSIELDVIAPLTFNTPAALADVNIALPAFMYIVANGGVQPYTFSLMPGSTMPPGLTFTNGNAVGLIQGTPSTPGSYSFTVQVTDSFTPAFKISQTFTMNVLNGLVLPITTLPDAVQNLSYTEYLQPAGGTPPYLFVLGPNSSMPPGMLLDTTNGKVYGTPTTVTAPFYDPLLVTISDSASPPATISSFVTITVQPPLSFRATTLPDSARGLGYGGTITATGGRAPYTMRVTNGALPDGLTSTPFGGSFNISGVPTTDGLFKFTVQISDSYETPNTAKQDFQIRISDPMTLSGPTLVQILYNQSYSTTFTATGGFPPYTWRMDRMPPGFTFDPATGTLSGTPNGASYTSPNITVHDSSNPPLTATYYNFALEVWGKLVMSTTSLPTVATASTVLLQPLANGGAGPYQWSLSSGSLPPGLNLDSLVSGNVTISGSPTTAGVYTFSLNISDGNPGTLHQTTSQQLTWTVKDRGQMTRNDTIGRATALSNISILASISPFSDPSSAGPDVDVYSLSAAPGSVVQVYASPRNEFIQPPEVPNSLLTVLEIVDANGQRYQTCALQSGGPGTIYNLPCVNGLPGIFNIQGAYYSFQVPGTGTTPVTFYVRVSDARGDARPDFIYTFTVFGVN